MAPRLAIVVASGFLQDETRRHGCLDLVELLGTLVRGNEITVHYRRWHDDPDRLGRYLYHRRVTHAILAGYSYGGSFCARASWSLAGEGITICHASISDGVHRWPWPRIYKNWRNLVPRRCHLVDRPALSFGPTVESIQHYYQRVDEPSGDAITCANPQTLISRSRIQNCGGHVSMDNLEAWHCDVRHAVYTWPWRSVPPGQPLAA